MNELVFEIKKQISDCFKNSFGEELEAGALKLEKTDKDHKGDLTFVVFPYLRLSKKNPEQTAEILGKYLQEHCMEISKYNVIKGFLNLELSPEFWLKELTSLYEDPDPGQNSSGKGKSVMVEFSSPNTNKPLHLGHVRNITLGYSVSRILEFAGYRVIKANLINDRGIHICKSMLAWQKFGIGETPESAGMKGDHLVGKYYVEFDRHLQEEVKAIQVRVNQNDLSDLNDQVQRQNLIQLLEKLKAESDNEKRKETESEIKTLITRNTQLMSEANEMLRKWESGDAETLKIWEMMNSWVYKGFDETYRRMGVSFDKYYYESNTYLLGKRSVMEGLEMGVFQKDEDGSVWVDLTEEGLDRKILLRADGTSVYMTQDIGTAQMKYDDAHMDHSVYVVGNEQDYHFKVLKLILKKLNKPYADGVYHLSYGMVDLPHGKMKSREGTVVDADELMQSMYQSAKQITMDLGKTEGLAPSELELLYETIAQGALKYFLLKVDPVKRMLFNPEESIDFQGNTGPFIQYTYARIRSILRNTNDSFKVSEKAPLMEVEKELLALLSSFSQKSEQAAIEYNPALIANFIYEVARSFNRLYHEVSILGEQDENIKQNRLAMCSVTSKTIKNGMELLGINVPERM
ncbi:MAG: arginine--tRNA ligase [Flavobacteriales bacterium]|nr:arginine--tRNA ligase [Flavobacteriales bacterium]